MSLLQIEKLTIAFGGLTAVNALDLRMESGAIFSLIGPNGAGKTTVFNAITGVYDPTRGQILIDGRPAAKPFTRHTLLGMLTLSLLTGVGATLAINAETLWEAALTSNYIYQQAFPWRKGLVDLVQVARDLPVAYSLLPLAVGAALGFSGAYAVWRRTRRSPDIIARSRIARTFQNIRLFQQMTVLENILVGMDTKLHTRFWHAALRLPAFRREQEKAVGKALAILAFVELDHEAYAIASSLSYGHQRRLEIARALASEPKLLLLDEPAAGMNPAETVELMELIRKIRETGVSILLIEHDMKVVMGVSDRIAVLDYGNKIAEGPPQTIKNDPQVKKAYLGTADL